MEGFFSKLLDDLSEYLADRKGLLPLLGSWAGAGKFPACADLPRVGDHESRFVFASWV